MSQPKPASADTTKKGTPRQRAPGAGRPAAHRPVTLSRVSLEAKEHLAAIAAHLKCSQAEAIEHAALRTFTKLPKA